MSRKRKSMYSEMIDNKFSFNFYNYSKGADNSKIIKDRCKVLKLIINQELTDKQKEVLTLYYNYNLNIPQISERLGKNKSTISRSLKTSESIIRSYMKYSNFRQ